MKRPYLDEIQRLMIRMDTSPGHRYQLALNWAKLKREIDREIKKLIK